MRALPVLVILGLACAGPPAPTAPETEAPTPADPPPPPRPIVAYTAPARPPFPLEVGDHWRWTITRSTGAGMRVLFIPTEPARSEVEAEWELRIDAADGARHRATWTRTKPGALPASTALVLWNQDGELWMEGPSGPTRALEMTVPPDPVATEKVPCVAHFLEGLPGVCSPAPGGPLRVPPGPVDGVVSSEDDGGRSLAQVLVGIGTAGVIIPGNKTATIYAALSAWEPKRPAATADRVERWRASPDASTLDALLAGPPLDREEAAAIVALGVDDETVATRVMARLGANDRVAMMRVVLSVRDARLERLARLVPALVGPPDPARAASVIALLPEEDRAAGQGILSGEWKVLGEVLRAPPEERRRTLESLSTPLAPGEADAIVGAFEDAREPLAVLLPRVAPRERLALLTTASAAQTFDHERLALLEGQDQLLAAEAGNLAGVGKLVDTCTFDDGKKGVIDAFVKVAPAPRRGALIRLGVEKMSFDDARLELMDAWPAEVRAMSKADRAATLGAFVFKEDEARARFR